MTAPPAVQLTGNDLTFAQLYDVALHGAKVSLAPDAIERMKASRAIVDRVVSSGETAYGINTGFGKLASVRISTEQVRQLQINLVRSHACGVGAPLSEAETRAMMLLRANALAKGLSGIRPETVEVLCAMLNAKVHPVIPSQGSVGASGDLAPLAHLAHVVIGEGHARIGSGEIITGADAMRQAKINPVALEAKEGLSLLNGTQGMLALLSLALRDADIATDTADVAAALSLDALRGSPGAFDSRIMHARAYAGASMTARNLAHLNEGSQIRESHRDSIKDPRVQDAYSLRCTPQVHGAVRDSLAQAREMAAVELNSATDNPLVFARGGNKGGDKNASGDIISGGNFHGQPLAMAADQVAIAIATLGGISERRIEQMTNPLTSMLPAFLTPEPGLNSGFMIAQVTAAALTSENKALSTPHSVDSISTSGNQEDYVSMGMSGARRLNRMLDNLRHTVAIELLCAAQGIELLAPLQTGTLAKKAIATIRAASPKVVEDRPLAPDIESVTAKIADGTFSAILH
jgi:histidine ammonia-lyase